MCNENNDYRANDGDEDHYQGGGVRYEFGGK